MENKISLVRELARQMISVIDADGNDYKPTPIGILKLSTRTLNSLKNAKVNYVEQLVWLKRLDILRLRSMGRESFAELNAAVKNIGLRGWD